MTEHIRFHGRGGEGVKLASRIVGRAAFLAGRCVQDSPLYGAERRGAPVVAFVRLSDAPIYERGYIDQPDVVVVMDTSLLDHAEAAVLDGVDRHALVLVNSSDRADVLRTRYGIKAHVLSLDVSSIALEVLGTHLLSAPMAGFTAKAMAAAPWHLLAEAVRTELRAVGVAPESIERNLQATQRAVDQTTTVHAIAPPRRRQGAPAPVFVFPRLPARMAAPSITVDANSMLRTTAGWRVFRPHIDLGRCTRCFLCFALCPDAAIHLDTDNFPVVDYDHCKGCLICSTECPPQAISALREMTA